MKLGKIFSVMSLGLVFSSQAFAQQTYQEIEQLTVNESVTTVITASEPIRFVDSWFCRRDKSACNIMRNNHSVVFKNIDNL